MTDTKKRTKKENFAILHGLVLDTVENDEEMDTLLDFINNEVELLDRKSGKTTLSPVQKENLDIAVAIPSLLADNSEGMTATEIGKALDLSVQRVSPIITKLEKAGEVVKTKEGKAVKITLS